MITINIRKGSGSHYVCQTDDAYLALCMFLEYDMGKSGGGGAAHELFMEIGQLLSGEKTSIVAWGDLVRVEIGTSKVVITPMPTSIGKPCMLSLEELLEAVLHWYDRVNPELAKELREIRSSWSSIAEAISGPDTTRSP